MAQESEELKGVIFDIQNNYEKSYFPKSGPNAGCELFKHLVAFVDKTEGVFFQKTKELVFNKEKCFIGQEVCYTARPSTVVGKPTVLTMCNDKDTNVPLLDVAKVDISKTTGVAFSYAKDIVIASFTEQGKTTDEYVSEIKRVATDIKNFLLENN